MATRPGQRHFAHAENYFGRTAKTAILAVLKETKPDTAPACEKAKKADL
jgi:hypothetical protein